MASITINLPDHLEVKAFDIQMLIAAKLYQENKLTSGEAAKMVGLSKRSFLELLGKYKVSVFGYDFQGLEEDLNNA